jgi:hypothetical protein
MSMIVKTELQKIAGYVAARANWRGANWRSVADSASGVRGAAVPVTCASNMDQHGSANVRCVDHFLTPQIGASARASVEVTKPVTPAAVECSVTVCPR